ncbi:MAG: hypothetical protein CUN53_21810, partial [Phototrophicales bacterium]
MCPQSRIDSGFLDTPIKIAFTWSATMLDLTGVPLVDVHCHPFTRKERLSADDFINVTAFGGGSPQYLEEAGIAVDESALAF